MGALHKHRKAIRRPKVHFEGLGYTTGIQSQSRCDRRGCSHSPEQQVHIATEASGLHAPQLARCPPHPGQLSARGLPPSTQVQLRAGTTTAADSNSTAPAGQPPQGATGMEGKRLPSVLACAWSRPRPLTGSAQAAGAQSSEHRARDSIGPLTVVGAPNIGSAAD